MTNKRYWTDNDLVREIASALLDEGKIVVWYPSMYQLTKGLAVPRIVEDIQISATGQGVRVKCVGVPAMNLSTSSTSIFRIYNLAMTHKVKNLWPTEEA